MHILKHFSVELAAFIMFAFPVEGSQMLFYV